MTDLRDRLNGPPGTPALSDLEKRLMIFIGALESAAEEGRAFRTPLETLFGIIAGVSKEESGAAFEALQAKGLIGD